MSVVAISTPFNISIDLNIAPVWKRMVAFLIDGLILVVYALAMSMLVLRNIERAVNSEAVSFLFTLFLVILPVSFYHFLMEVFFSGQSIGKRAMGIRVVNFTGNEGSVSQYFLRMLFRASSISPLAAGIIASLFAELGEGGIGSETFILFYLALIFLVSGSMFLYFAISKYSQRIGDKLANTLVIETHTAADIHQTIFLDINDQGYQVQYPEVMKLTDRDINGIRNLLEVRRITAESEAYMQRIASRIEEVLGIKRTQEPYEFLAQLLRDYNFLTRK